MGKKNPLIDISADTPAIDAARFALRKRLRTLERAMPKAHDADPTDDEPIHRLRVATRRAGATLRAFSDIIPADHIKPLKNRLKKIRRVAGPARTADVHTKQFRKWFMEASSHLQTPIAYIIGRLREERHHAQPPIRDETGDSAAHRIATLRRDIVKDMRKAAKHPNDAQSLTLAQFASRTLPDLADRAQEVSRRMTSLEDLHQFRIEGKRLRYAVETYSPAIPDHRGEALDRLSDLQEHLGDLNDSGELLDRIRRYRAEAEEFTFEQHITDGLAIVEHGLARRLDATRDAFLHWWGDRGIHWLLAPVRDACADLNSETKQHDDTGRSDVDHERAAG